MIGLLTLPIRLVHDLARYRLALELISQLAANGERSRTVARLALEPRDWKGGR